MDGFGDQVRKSVKVGARVFAALGFFALFVVWDFYGYWPIPEIHGRVDATIDLARGRYRMLGYGLPPLGMDKYISSLHRRYGVDYRAVAGCTVSKETMDYVSAYDKASGSAINKKFGHDIFKEVANESFESRN